MTHTHRGLRRLASRVLDEQTMARLVEPALTDIDVECADAVCEGRLWLRRWVWIRGHVAFLTMLFVYVAEWTANIPQELTASDRRILTRVSTIGAGIAVVVTLMLTWVPLRALTVRPHSAARILFATLIPHALPVAIPMGVLFGVLIGRDATRRSLRSSVSIVAGAFVLSIVSFATLAWVMPVGNQAFRVAMAGHQVRRGDNELTLGEMRRAMSAELSVDRVGARSMAVSYYMRYALSCAPIAFACFGFAWTRRPHRRVVLAVAGGVIAVGYDVLLLSGRELGRAGTFQPAVSAWVPNAIVLGVSAAVFTIERIRQRNAAVAQAAD